MKTKIKPSTEIRNLKKEIADLKTLCEMAGVPPLIIHFPKLAIRGKRFSKEDFKWAKQKIKEYKKIQS